MDWRKENEVIKKTNFDRYLKEQKQDAAFAARFERAGEAWDVAFPLRTQYSELSTHHSYAVTTIMKHNEI